MIKVVCGCRRGEIAEPGSLAALIPQVTSPLRADGIEMEMRCFFWHHRVQ
jgi:hypothetical protein